MASATDSTSSYSAQRMQGNFLQLPSISPADAELYVSVIPNQNRRFLIHKIIDDVSKLFVCTADFTENPPVFRHKKIEYSSDDYERFIRYYKHLNFEYLSPKQSAEIQNRFEQIQDPKWFVHDQQLAAAELENAPFGTFFFTVDPEDGIGKYRLYFKTVNGVELKKIAVCDDGAICCGEIPIASSIVEMLRIYQLGFSLCEWLKMKAKPHEKAKESSYKQLMNPEWYIGQLEYRQILPSWITAQLQEVMPTFPSLIDGSFYRGGTAEKMIEKLKMAPEGTFYTCCIGVEFFLFVKMKNAVGAYKLDVISTGQFEISGKSTEYYHTFEQIKERFQLTKPLSHS